MKNSYLKISIGTATLIFLLAGCTRQISMWTMSYDTLVRSNATHTAFVATAVAQGTPQPAVSSPTRDAVFYKTQMPIDTQSAKNKGVWYVSGDTQARVNATQTAFAATAMAQGTPQAQIPYPTWDPVFYLTQVAADTQTASASQMQAWTAIAQGTLYLNLTTTSTEDLLARLQQTSLAETAVAQGTSAAFLPTFTPHPTLIPAPTATLISLPSVPNDWYTDPVTGPLLAPIRGLGGEDLVNQIIIILLTAFGTFLLFASKSIMQAFYIVGKEFWNLTRRLNKDYQFELVYLDWMIGQYRHLGMLPAQVAARRWGERQQLLDLEQIYTRLSLSNQADDETWNIQTGSRTRWSKVLHPALRLLKGFLKIVFTAVLSIVDRAVNIIGRSSNVQGLPASIFELTALEKWFPEPKYVPGSLGLIVDRMPRLVIKGDPGSGKTTLMRFLAITCARALRENEEEGDSKRTVFQRLSWSTRPYPIMIRLSRHADVIQWGDKKSLIDAFKDELPFDLRRICPEGFFERLLHKKSCLILLDAFDELGSPRARSTMSEYVRGFLEIYGKEKHRFIVTTRIVGYEGQLDRAGFQSRSVQPLLQEERKSLIHLRYKAYALVEKLGRTPAEARSIEWYLQQREQALIERIEKMPRLAQLATNPMLLSLITLVHFLKVELPDERVLLYRDCVEILTERWQRYKREETGGGDYPAQDLTLAQKTKLLQELAFGMQMRRDTNSSQALLSKRVAVTIISDALVHLFGDASNAEELTRRAEEWIMGIQTDSGILLEQGLDQDGEPLIGFSHLTFQEYLTAVAVNENPSYFEELMQNLINPAWREVIRLYVVLADNATSVIQTLCKEDHQPIGQILAGWCLTEKLKKVDAGVTEIVRAKLIDAFKTNGEYINEIGEIMEKSMLILHTIPFLLEQAANPDLERQVAAIRALRGIQDGNEHLLTVRSLLVSIVDSSSSVKARVAAQETLSHIGDPRFESYTPLMVRVPAYALNAVKSDVSYTLFDPSLQKGFPQNFIASLLLLFAGFGDAATTEARFLAQKNYRYWRKFVLRSKNYTDEFEIARFPVTNLEYSRFANETGHPAPTWWDGLSYPIEKAIHPVRGIQLRDMREYCRWLSRKTGDDYRLPLEWEWEAAAGLLDGYIFPWGNEFDQSKCNSRESELLETTPVGIYHDVRSPHGMQDSAGNVREYTRTVVAIYASRSLLWGMIALILGYGRYTMWSSAIFLAVIVGVGHFIMSGAGLVLNTIFVGEGITKGGSCTDKSHRIQSFSRNDVNRNSYCGFRVARYGKQLIKS